jgi:cyclophilin family peptidyl-prolyl cis-trans isomerase
MSVILETTIGDLVIDLFTEERPRGILEIYFLSSFDKVST